MHKYLIFIFFISCSPEQLLNPDRAVTGGAVGAGAALAVDKTIDAVREVAKYHPELILESFEVCYKYNNDSFKCVLSSCDSNCERFISVETAFKAINEKRAIIKDIDSHVKFISGIEYWKNLEENKDLVKENLRDYSNIDKILIIN